MLSLIDIQGIYLGNLTVRLIENISNLKVKTRLAMYNDTVPELVKK